MLIETQIEELTNCRNELVKIHNILKQNKDKFYYDGLRNEGVTISELIQIIDRIDSEICIQNHEIYQDKKYKGELI